MSQSLSSLVDAVSDLHDCHAQHFGTEDIRIACEDGQIWEARVEVFQVSGHKEACVAYGWVWKDSHGKNCIIGVLQISPVESALNAVEAAIASGHFSGGRAIEELSKDSARGESIPPS